MGEREQDRDDRLDGAALPHERWTASKLIETPRHPQAISYHLVRALLIQLRRGTIASPGKVKGVRVWEAVA